MKNKRLIYLSSFFLIILLIISVLQVYKTDTLDSNDRNIEEVKTGDCPPIIRYDNYNYQLYKSNQDSNTIDRNKLEKLWEITGVVDLTVMPKENFETNCNYMDLIIYRYNEDEILVEYPIESGKYQIFKK